MTNPNYTELERVLSEAVSQAAEGKGRERHAVEGERFENQQICQLGRWMGSHQGPVFQACKKALESTRLPPARAKAELLGAINYLAAAVLLVEEMARQDPTSLRIVTRVHPVPQGFEGLGKEMTEDMEASEEPVTPTGGYVVELEPGVWLATGDGDPPRTCIKANAQVFSHAEAEDARDLARLCRPFLNATIKER